MVSIKILIRRLPIRRIRREGNPTRMGGMRIVVEVSRLLGGILHIVLDVISFVMKILLVAACIDWGELTHFARNFSRFV